MLGVVLLIIISACAVVDNESDSKFVAFVQQDSGGTNIDAKFLIKGVHKSAWQIGIGFADNNDCAGSFSPRHKGELQAGISEAFRVWLASLADKPRIVNNFNYLSLDSYVATIIQRRSVYLLRKNNSAFDLQIVIRCERGRSFAFRRSGQEPVINLFRGSLINASSAVTSLRQYYKVILLHEIGHAFGLGDTYIDQHNVFRYSRSDGGSRLTAGKQPLAIMNAIYQANPAYYQGYRLGADDVAGIKWLYRYYVEKSINSVRECLGDYTYEQSTKGCRPRHRLIFAVKQGDLLTVRNLLKDDQTIDLAEKDNLGNTALHHAAKQSRRHGKHLYLFLQKRFSERQRGIRNLAGQTADDIYISSLWAGHYLLETNSFLNDRRIDLALSYLGEASAAGYPGTVNRLTAESLNTRDSSQQNGLLHQAVAGSNPKIVTQLLSHPLIKVNLANKSGDRALHKLAALDRAFLAKKFLDRQDLDINSQNNNGDSALHVAARAGNPSIVRLLLSDSRIDITITNNDDKTARDVAGDEASRHQEGNRRNKYRHVIGLIDDHD